MTSPEKPAAGTVKQTVYQFNARGRGGNDRGGRRTGRGNNIVYCRVVMDNTTNMNVPKENVLLLQDQDTLNRKRQSEEQESSGLRDDSRDSKKKKAVEDAAHTPAEDANQPRGSQ